MNKGRIFLLNRSEILDRLEPKFYTDRYINNENRLRKSKFPIKHLSEVTSLISDGTHFTPTYVSEGIKFISVKDVRRSSISFDNVKFITEEEANKLDKRCKPQRGDVLLTKIGATFGFAALVETKDRFQIFVSLALLRPNNEIYPKFLEVFLNSDIAYIQYERVIKGAGVPDLHLEDIRKIKIPLPPLEIQKRIADKFDEAFKIKLQKEATANKLLANIDTYILEELGLTLFVSKNELSNRIFTTSYSEVSGLRLDPLYFKNKDKIESNKFPNNPLRRIANIKKGQSITKDKIIAGNYPVIAGGKSSPYSHGEFNVEGNAITISASGAYSGFVWYHDYPFFASDCIVLQSMNEAEISTQFIYYVMKALQGEIYKFQQGAGQPHVYARDIEKVHIPTPSPSKQNEILTHINDINKKIKILQTDAISTLENSKTEIERMLIG